MLIERRQSVYLARIPFHPCRSVGLALNSPALP
nr:MAG TPA: hypothetical protein [Caudoviricetes sp.]